MIDRTLLRLAGCIVFRALLALGIASAVADTPVVAPAAERIEAGPPPQMPQPKDAVPPPTALPRPVFSATRSPGEQDKPGASDDSGLAGLRLTGVIIQPGRRLAIFATPTAETLVRSEGENLGNWRIDRITAHEILLINAAQTRTWELKPDPNLVRAAPPVAAPPGQTDERLPPRRNRHKTGSG